MLSCASAALFSREPSAGWFMGFRLTSKSNIGDGHEYVFQHERPYRIEALAGIAKRLSSSDYWE
jgi:hypothetical protein